MSQCSASESGIRPAPLFSESEARLLERARRVGETTLAPNATESDLMERPNPPNYAALGAAGLLGLGIPESYGGQNASALLQREITETLAFYCGVTAFVQAQHHGPCRMIANAPNEALKRRLLPDLATGAALCGVSFAHLRRPGPPILRAEPVSGGYRLNGTAPWVTGWGLMNQFVYGAACLDGRFVYLWSPVSREDFPELFADVAPADNDWGECSVSAPLALCAMNASATVEVTFENRFVPEAHWLQESDREKMLRSDRSNVLGATALVLGCGAAGVRLLCATAERRNLPAVERAAQRFHAEWTEAKSNVMAWITRSDELEFFENAITIRAWCIDLAMRVAHANVAAASGAANNRTHPAQRLLREAMFYTVQAQTFEVMEATLRRLERAEG